MLVVDDQPSLRLLCRVNLELEGFDVSEAATLDAARAILAAEDVALVLLDLHVGNQRGEALLDELRAREPHVAVVVVTGSSEVEAGEQRLAADAVLGKPFEIDFLIETVRALTDPDVAR